MNMDIIGALYLIYIEYLFILFNCVWFMEYFNCFIIACYYLFLTIVFLLIVRNFFFYD